MVTKALEDMVREIEEVNKALGKALTKRAINTLLDLERASYIPKPGEYDQKIRELKVLRREFESREKFYKPGEENKRKFDIGILNQLDRAYSRLLKRLSYLG